MSACTQVRSKTNPLFNDRKLKLGTFGTNLKGGCTMGTGEGVLDGNWSSVVELAKLADEMEFEAIVPVGRFRGFGGETDFGGTSFEVFTYAAGLATATKFSSVFATSHVPTINPVLAAKMAATIDHISGGRFTMNVVSGWHKTEMEMFGKEMRDHDTRYDMAAEWVEIIDLLWTRDEPLDYDGKFFNTKDALLKPRPLQRPRPPVMCAGQSQKGQHFTAKYGDIGFVCFEKTSDPEQMRGMVDRFKRLAREEYGRELSMWTNAYIIQADTEQEAKRLYDYYVIETGDAAAARNCVNINSQHAQTWGPDAIKERLGDTIAGFGNYPLIGTPEQVVDGLKLLSDLGLDGAVLAWPAFHSGMEQFRDVTIPLLKQAGLR
jgi:FMNH2-dependent dimethyl sulfone monooxygenase